MQSEARKQLIETVKPYLETDDQFVVKSGLDFWFTPEGAKARLPTRWKQFLIIWSAIFPLALSISRIVDKITVSRNIVLTRPVKLLALTFLVVLMMAYVVMPRCTKLMHKW